MDTPIKPETTAGTPIEAGALLAKYRTRLSAVTDELLMTQVALETITAENQALRKLTVPTEESTHA